MEKVGSTNKLTFNQPKDTPTTNYTLDNMEKCLLTSMVPTCNNTRFGIEMKLYLNKMGAGNALFAHAIGAMFQGYGAFKLGSVYPSSDHTPSSYRNIYSASWLMWQFKNHQPSHNTWYMVFLDTGRSIQILMVIWNMMASWSPSEISGPHWEQQHGTATLFTLAVMNTATMMIHWKSWHPTSYRHSPWR